MEQICAKIWKLHKTKFVQATFLMIDNFKICRGKNIEINIFSMKFG